MSFKKQYASEEYVNLTSELVNILLDKLKSVPA